MATSKKSSNRPDKKPVHGVARRSSAAKREKPKGARRASTGSLSLEAHNFNSIYADYIVQARRGSHRLKSTDIVERYVISSGRILLLKLGSRNFWKQSNGILRLRSLNGKQVTTATSVPRESGDSWSLSFAIGLMISVRKVIWKPAWPSAHPRPSCCSTMPIGTSTEPSAGNMSIMQRSTRSPTLTHISLAVPSLSVSEIRDSPICST